MHYNRDLISDIGDRSAICNACNGVRNQDPRSIKGISSVQITFWNTLYTLPLLKDIDKNWIKIINIIGRLGRYLLKEFFFFLLKSTANTITKY